MNRKLLIIAFLCATAFMPSIATAQNVFEKQKVVIWDIIDRNDRKFDSGLKNAMLQGFRDALVGSEDYEVYEVNTDDIKNSLIAKGQNHSFPNICKIIGEKSDFILFTEIESSFSAIGAQSQNVKVNISCSLYKIETATKVASDQDQTAPNKDSVLSAASQLVSRMLGIKTAFQSQRTYQQASYQSSYSTPPSYSQQRQQYATLPKNHSYSVQKNIAVWKIEDSCDRELSLGVKDYMRSSITKIARSSNYMIHELNSNHIQAVEDKIRMRGLPYTRENIAKVLQELYGVSNVIFTKTNMIHLSSCEIVSVSMVLFNSETQKTMAQVGFNLHSTLEALERDFAKNASRLLR